jgi:hypothetical protein
MGLLASAGLLGLLFVLRERAAPEPMIDLSLFANAQFSGVSLGSLTASATIGVAPVYLALFLQNGWGLSPLQTGARLLPIAVAAFAAAPLTAPLLLRFPLWPLAAGALGLSALGLLMTAISGLTGEWLALLPGFVLGGAGFGMTGAVMSAGVYRSVAPAHQGPASRLVTVLRYGGVAVGMVGFGAGVQEPASGRANTLLTVVPIAARDLSRSLFLAGIVALGAAVLCAFLMARPDRVLVPGTARAGDLPAPGRHRGEAPQDSAPQDSAPQDSAPQDSAPRGDELPAVDLASPASARGPKRLNPDSHVSMHLDLIGIVNKVHVGVPDLYGVMIASADGLVIAHSFPQDDAARVASMAAMAAQLGRRLTQRAGLGPIGETVARAENGYFIVYPAGDSGVLVLSGPADSNLGLMRMEAEAAAREISRTLS